MSKTKKTYWWLDKYSVDELEYKKDKKSNWWGSSYINPTKGWMDKLGGYDFSYSWFDRKKNKKDILYKKLLDQLQTSINVIDCDKNLKVAWSSGEDTNSPDNDCVYLSPDSLIEGDKLNPVVKDNILDVLTGKVYLSKVLHNQINKRDFELSKKFRSTGHTKHSICVSKLWESLETQIAKKFMENNWQGFMPHVVKELDYSSSNKEIVQNYINSSVDKPDLDAIILGISWNIVHEHNSVEIPDVYDECLEFAAETLEKIESEKERFKACSDIVTNISRILKEQEEKSPNPPNTNGGSTLSIKDFNICDGQLFGERVKNRTDVDLSQIKSSEEDKSLNSVTNSSAFELNNLKNKFIIPDISPESKDIYIQKVKDLRGVINGIKNNFYFINNKTTLESYGHLSGDIDDNNLYKLSLNDDRIMSKKDIISHKKIAICLLVDESGSMDDKYVQATNVAISLAEGLKDYFGISIYGHTAEHDHDDEYIKGCLITEYCTPRNNRIESCVNIEAKSENVDGVAIELVAKKFYQDFPDQRRIIFHISDGEPSSSYYGGHDADKHVSNICQMVRSRLETEVYGIGICDAFESSTGKKLYGSDNYVILDDVESSIGIITRFLKQVCNKNQKVYTY